MRRYKSGSRVTVYSSKGIGRAKPRNGRVLAVYPKFVLVEVEAAQACFGETRTWRECFWPEEVGGR